MTTAHADLATARDAAAWELAAFTASRATELATANELAAELATAKEAAAAAESALAAGQAELATTKEAATASAASMQRKLLLRLGYQLLALRGKKIGFEGDQNDRRHGCELEAGTSG